MGLEIELKYGATPQILAAVEQDLGGDWTTIEMRTAYYDTEDRSLSARRWTLRRRLENGVSVCTLKMPALQGRREYEVLCDRIEDGVEELCKLSGDAELLQLTAGGLVEVCGAAFTRRAKSVSFPGFTAELALDQGVLFSGENQQGLCELEVELKDGDPSLLQTYGLCLAARYALQPEPKSKFKRALSLGRE